ncbi:MAG: 4Fe-4S cluster-binding domain-containing protein, partial [Kiritimatiellae bacterium]|nr:4Fe-4S cluster-binding domain-containing protein [Kiritimatiellia bacterium]
MDCRSLVVTSTGLARYLAGRGWDSRAIEAAVPVRPPAFSFLATPFYLDLIDWSDPDDPLRRMIWPDPREYDVRSYERADPIGDRAHEPVPGVVHRYPDRCLVMPTSACALHCRFCFRRNLLGGQRWDAGEALRYVSSHAEIQEIILSGGDPLMLPETELEHVMRDLGGIGHIRRLRVHTRIPVADPERISESLLRALRAGRRPLRMVLHINHPREVTPDLRRAVHRLQSGGREVLSQSVLLR